MRDSGDRKFAEGLSEGIPDATPILFCKDEGDYLKVSFFPSRRDFVEGTNRQSLGGRSRLEVTTLAKKRKAKIVNF